MFLAITSQSQLDNQIVNGMENKVLVDFLVEHNSKS